MEWKLNPNAVNQLVKGTTVFSEGESVFGIALVIKGRVLIHNDGVKVIVNSGAFLGVNDLYTGKYQSTYTAIDDLILYVFSVNNIDELEQMLSSNSDYHGFMVASNNRMIEDLNLINTNLHKHWSGIYDFITESYSEYINDAVRRGYRARKSERFDELYLPENDLEMIEDKINYYIECINIPKDVVKAFYSYGNEVTLYQVEDQSSIINQQIETLKELSNGFVTMVECLYDDTDSCLFQLIAAIAIDVVKAGGDTGEFVSLLDKIIEEVNKADRFIDNMLGNEYKVNRSRMEEIYNMLLSGNKGTSAVSETYLKYSKEDTEMILEELSNSFQKILVFGEIDRDKANEMNKNLLDFINLADRGSSDNSARTIRRNLTADYYELYKAVFLKAYKVKKTPKLIDLFLRYGYADERLLTNEQIFSLYYLPETEKTGPCNVYDIKEWLTLIYEGKKDPSKNEFDMEYPEYINSLKRQGKVTDKTLKEWLNNPEKRLDYEIQNMFKYNNRTTNGQISTFVPILHKDLLFNEFKRLHLNSEKINKALEDLLLIDYSIFNKEVIYSNEKKNIVKEYIIKQVFPDIILMPTVGSNGIMWQEITGKRRDSSARFLFPAFTDGNLFAMMVKVIGRFRWEMCRTIEGTAWNDIKNRSLTSEYYDYLQFYKKNRELSEERKEKIKKQIQKGRNNSREVFLLDYEEWIHYEANGAIKLNKPVREMLATYCPFARELRERMIKQPLFEEAMSRYQRDKLKRIRELESRIKYLERDNIEIPKELIDTLNYYKES
ncbi:MAG TPA: hypothetical protein GXZ21_12315 [Clostridiales bacterium]|nr:hypothetical protein [Clostridiales bacterium]